MSSLEDKNHSDVNSTNLATEEEESDFDGREAVRRYKGQFMSSYTAREIGNRDSSAETDSRLVEIQNHFDCTRWRSTRHSAQPRQRRITQNSRIKNRITLKHRIRIIRKGIIVQQARSQSKWIPSPPCHIIFTPLFVVSRRFHPPTYS